MSNKKISELDLSEGLVGSDAFIVSHEDSGNHTSQKVTAGQIVQYVAANSPAGKYDTLVSTYLSSQYWDSSGSEPIWNIPPVPLDSDGQKRYGLLYGGFDTEETDGISAGIVLFSDVVDKLSGVMAKALDVDGQLTWKTDDGTGFATYEGLSNFVWSCISSIDAPGLKSGSVMYVAEDRSLYMYLSAIPDELTSIADNDINVLRIADGSIRGDVERISVLIQAVSRPTTVRGETPVDPTQPGYADKTGYAISPGDIVLLGTNQFLALRTPTEPYDTDAWVKLTDSSLYMLKYDADKQLSTLSAEISSLHEYQHTTLVPEWADSHDSATSAVSSDMEIIADVSATSQTLSAPGAGDTVIVRKPIFPGDSPTLDTAYSWYDGEWRALQGNYSADNVFFDCDIKLAGNWVNVGNISKSSTTATGTYAAKGKSIKQILSAMFCAVVQPSISSTVQPSVSLTAKKDGTAFTTDKWVEVGTSVSFGYSTSFNAGSYTAFPGQVATGVTAESYSVKLVNGTSTVEETLTTASGTFSTVTLADGDQYRISATISHTAGVRAKDNLGEPSDPEFKIAAGSKTSTSKTVKSYRKYFKGALATKADITDYSAYVRTNLTGSTSPLAAGGSFTIDIPVGTMRVAFAYDASVGTATVTSDKQLGADITSAAVVSTQSVASASGNPINYKVYIFNFAEATTDTDVYTVAVNA